MIRLRLWCIPGILVAAALLYIALGTTVRAQTIIAFVQTAYATPQTPQGSVSVTFAAAQSAGNLNVIAVGWNDTTSQVSSVSDTSGNTYVRAIGPTIRAGLGGQSIYYAANIAAAPAAANRVTVTFSAAAAYPDIRIAEYRGLATVNPVDVVAGATGSGATSNSGSATTTNANDLIIGANLVGQNTKGPGTGFTSRVITNPDADILEDRVVTAAGSYSATAVLAGGTWVMQMVAFRAGGPGDTQAPTAPSGLVASAVSSSQVNLAWSASTDNVAVTGYRVERCLGVSCSSFAQIGTSATNTYSDTTAVPSSTYSYRVLAADAAGNLSAYSNVATATTPAMVDTQPPTAPAGLTATATTPSQVGLSWTAATDNVGVTGYLVERCTGVACSNFAQIGTTGSTTFSDASVTASTTYQYRVRATDAAGNLGAYSSTAAVTTPATADTQPPTAPGSLSASPVSSAQIDLAWTAATDNVGVTGYQIEGCQGAGCSAFALIGTVTGTTFSSSGLASGTTYSYRVRATDAVGNVSAYSPVATASTPSVPAVSFVQVNAATPQSSASTVNVPFGTAQSAGNLNVVAVGWNAPTGQVQSVTDSAGNVYAVAAAAIVNPSFGTQVIYYAANIKTAATNSVTVTFSSAVPYADVRIAEYSGLNSASPMDGFASAVGTGTSSASGALVTTNPTDLLVAANLVTSTTTGAGSGFASRVITNPDADILEDRFVTSAGSYIATAPMTSGAWIMQMVAFKAGVVAPDTVSPSAPGALTATAASGNQINLSWTAATDNVGVTSYSVERCTGIGCTSFGSIAAVVGSSTSFSDPTVVASTSYSYRVQASDAAGNAGPYSAIVSTATLAPDITPPSAPGTLIATAVSGTEIDLSWGPATDDTGVIGYRLERCQGVGCTAFNKFGTTIAGTTFSDTSLSINTSYSYIVRAQDAAGNVGPYSNVASATTLPTNPSLVGAYSFDEGSGTNITDLSGHGNNGTVANATWTSTGKFGKALVFNGVSSVVTIPDSPTLRLTSGMTLEAWVNPSVTSTGWKDVVYKGNDNYYLEGATPTGVPMIGITVGTAHDEVFGSAPLAVNTWSFLAATYDGVNLRFYVNGTQVASQAHTGDILTSANPLQIGGDSIWGQFFQGSIDEVRVYNTALTTGQIQTDMVIPVGGSSPAVSLSPVSVDFGSQAVATAASPRAVTLTNGGNAPLNVTSIAVSGAQAADFAQTNNCIGTLSPLAACTITVGFTPSNTGTRTASVSIADNAPGSPHVVPLTGVGVGFGVSPQTALATPGQTQQFTPTGAGSSTLVWSVDGLVGGWSDRGTITTSGLYTPPTTAGTHIITVATTDGTQSANATVFVPTSAGMFTHHNDDARTGQNLNEIVLKPANVNSATFGKQAEYAIDGIAHASPLYATKVNIPGVGLKNVVYVATEHDSVYAFDADVRSAAPLWKVSFINPSAGITTVPNGDTGECCDITPEIGITGTPVIDPASSTLYVVAKTKEGTSTYRQRLHALDLATGAEKFGGPVLISASVPGTGTGSSGGQLAFNSLRENQRTALLLHNGVVYFGFGSHGDYQPYHGWLLGYNAATLQQVFVFNSTPNGEGGGIWQSGGGLAIDSAGNFFFATGDGSFSLDTGGKDYGDTFIKLSPSNTVVDTFTPHDESTIDSNNLDLDAGGMILLPDQPGAHPHLLVSAGKNGTIYVVDRDSMGGFHATDQNVQTLANIFPFGTPLPGNYSSPVYFNSTVYFAPVADVVQAFSLTNGLLSAVPAATTPQVFAYPGAALAISANAAADGILWAVQKNGTAPGTLRAYDATNITHELYNSDQASSGRDQLDVAAKFSIPLVTNGRVYVASEGKLTIYGLFP